MAAKKTAKTSEQASEKIAKPSKAAEKKVPASKFGEQAKSKESFAHESLRTKSKPLQNVKDKSQNKMREVKLEKVVLNVGGTGDKLEKGFKLIQIISGKKAVKVKATKRIPTWGVRPGLETGTKVTLRGEEAAKILGKVLLGVNNTLKARQIKTNFLSFGIHEYIEIPGVEYIREVGIMGFEITAVFARAGKRIERKKVKQGRARRIDVTPEEIEKFMVDHYKLNILRKQTQNDSK